MQLNFLYQIWLYVSNCYHVKTYNLSSNGRINDKSDIEAKMGGDLKYTHKLILCNINLTKSHFECKVLACNHNMKEIVIEGVHKYCFFFVVVIKVTEVYDVQRFITFIQKF